MTKILISILLLGAFLVPGVALATPSQYGATGLISVPTADTLDSGNLAIGLWGNISDTGTETKTIIPISLTMGLGSFIEAYGSFPNLLFNDNEAASGRGFADLGLKARILGKRSSPFKFALDVQARRHINDSAALDGLTDVLGRGIISLKTERLGLHLNGGYLFKDTKFNVDDQIVAGAGLELYPMARLRVLAEFDAATELLSGLDQPMEALFGFQYFISPHLTFHASYGTGLTDAVNDWRVITGLSTSQGIGTYTKPVPRIIEAPEVEKVEPIKKAKFKALTPLVPKLKKMNVDPVAKLEIPVDPEGETVIVDPSERLIIPGTSAISGPPVSPISSPAPASTPKAAAAGASSVKEIPVQPSPGFKTDIPFETVVYRKFRFDELNYEFDQFTLSTAGAKAVALVADKLRKENKFFILRVNGHTDTTGSATYNEKLGYKRAVSVAERLVVNEGFDPSRMFVKGIGEEEPIADNATPEGRSLNRRAEILVLLPKSK